MRELNLDILKEGLPGVTPARGAYYLEAAIVSLRKRGFSSGVKMKVLGDFKEEVQIIWSVELDENSVKTWKNEHHSSNYGAVGIALVLVRNLLGFGIFEEGRIGTGIDFWMSSRKFEEEKIAYSEWEARLEVSGIGKEAPGNTVNMRIHQKKEQIAASDDTDLPGWIVVVEFGSPKSKIIKK